MKDETRTWELRILDAEPQLSAAASLTVADLNGDGRPEIVIGGTNALRWYTLNPVRRYTVAEGGGRFVVGLAAKDIDGDEKPEIIAGRRTEQTASSSPVFQIVLYKQGRDAREQWAEHFIDPHFSGVAHDLVFADIDGDGLDEIIANAAYSDVPGLYIYKRGDSVTSPWQRIVVAEGVFAEGISLGDVDGDGRIEIVNGADLYRCTGEDPCSDGWSRKTFAPDFREMCRTAMLDITGNGLPDIIVAESEYREGKISWFENRSAGHDDLSFVEHRFDERLTFAHSLGAWKDQAGVRIFVAEMAAGGWGAPRNHDARLLEYRSLDSGTSWATHLISSGEGTHQATQHDIDGDGEYETIGKEWGKAAGTPRVQIWKRAEGPSYFSSFEHSFIDRDKPGTAIDICSADLTGNGLQDVLCGSWWYENPSWERRELPPCFEALTTGDIDGDGRMEIVAAKRTVSFHDFRINQSDWSASLTADLYWLKPLDARKGRWETHYIGTGLGDWPHGTLFVPLLPGGRGALLVAYHSANRMKIHHYPEIFSVPDDPTVPWSKTVLAPIQHGEEFAAVDLTGNGNLDVVAGPYWLENKAHGHFEPHRYCGAPFRAARLRARDLNGNGNTDVVMGEEMLDPAKQRTPFSRLAWFENPGSLTREENKNRSWEIHVIDKLRCPHSLDVADLDGDGEPEVVCGEHDPLSPGRSRCRVLVYKKADPEGLAWKRYVLDDRFEHHDGTKVFEVAAGELAIISHGWKDNRYVHLWRRR